MQMPEPPPAVLPNRNPLRWAIAMLLYAAIVAGVILGGYLICWRYPSTFIVQVADTPDEGSDAFSPLARLKQRLQSDELLRAAIKRFAGQSLPAGSVGPEIEQLRRRISFTPEPSQAAALRVLVTWPEEREGLAATAKDPRELAARAAQRMANCLLEELLADAGRPGPATSSPADAARKEVDKVRTEMEELLDRQMPADASAVAAVLSDPPARDDLAEVELARADGEQPAWPEMVALDSARREVLEAMVAAWEKVKATARSAGEDDLQAARDELQANLAQTHAQVSRFNELLRRQMEVLASWQEQIAALRSQPQARALAQQAARYQVLRERLALAQRKLAQVATLPAEGPLVATPVPPLRVLEPPTLSSIDQPAWPKMGRVILAGVLVGLPAPVLVLGGMARRLWSRR